MPLSENELRVDLLSDNIIGLAILVQRVDPKTAFVMPNERGKGYI